jgi:asparagine synthase (glutamine-hydrolysing)
VGLTGEGSDELFGGYPRYRLFSIGRRLAATRTPGLRQVARRLRRWQPRWARLLEAGGVDAATAAALNPAFVPIEDAARVVGLGDADSLLAPRRRLFQEAERQGLDELQCLLELERQTYLVSLLHRMDRMSMAAGLECRVPLLDEGVVAHAMSLPTAARIDLFETKKPLRQAAVGRFGRRHAHAPKSGFGVPVGGWLRRGGHLGAVMERCLDEPRTRSRGWVDVGLVRRKLQEHQSGSRDHTEMLWGVLNLELWARVCVDGDGPEAQVV